MEEMEVAQSVGVPAKVMEDQRSTRLEPKGFRNFGAHKVENQPMIHQNLHRVVQRCVNTIFFTIESLH
jgi:hypothetical protein